MEPLKFYPELYPSLSHTAGTTKMEQTKQDNMKLSKGTVATPEHSALQDKSIKG